MFYDVLCQVKRVTEIVIKCLIRPGRRGREGSGGAGGARQVAMALQGL